MIDNLEQLLRRADASAPAPQFAPSDLMMQVRRAARNQRRLAACGFSILFLLACAPLLLVRKQPSPIAKTIPQAPKLSNLDASIHEQTVALFEAAHRPRRSLASSDAFLAELQMQRNRAALILLRDANRGMSTDDPRAASALRRTIELFPETPAAARAGEELKQLDSSRSQL